MTQGRRYQGRVSEMHFHPSWDDLHDLERQLSNARHAIRVGIAGAFVVGILLGLCFGVCVLPWGVGR